MKWQVIAIMIMIYWILLGTILSYAVQDSYLFTPSMTGNQSYNIPFDTDAVNLSTLQAVGDDTTTRSFPEAMRIMWTFRTPTSGFPEGISDFLSTINWMLVILFGTAVYRILNPLSAT